MGGSRWPGALGEALALPNPRAPPPWATQLRPPRCTNRGAGGPTHCASLFPRDGSLSSLPGLVWAQAHTCCSVMRASALIRAGKAQLSPPPADELAKALCSQLGQSPEPCSAGHLRHHSVPLTAAQYVPGAGCHLQGPGHQRGSCGFIISALLPVLASLLVQGAGHVCRGEEGRECVCVCFLFPVET